MKRIECIKKGNNYEALNIGSWNEVIDYELPMGPSVLQGKVFVGQAVGATGSELSFQTLVRSFPARTAVSSTRTRHMRNFTSSSRVKDCIKSMEKSSRYAKERSSVYLLTESEL